MQPTLFEGGQLACIDNRCKIIADSRQMIMTTFLFASVMDCALLVALTYDRDAI